MKTIEIIEPGSLESFMEEIVPVMGHHRTPIYRGSAIGAHKVLPALLRTAMKETEFGDWSEFEAALIEKFKLRGRGELKFDPISELEWHIIGSHYGLPTRFTAWTENPLVALYFATAPGKDGGIVWRLLPGNADLVATQDFQVGPEEYRIYHPRHSNPELLAQRTCFLSHPLPKLDTSPISLEDYYENTDTKDYSMHLSKIVIGEEDKAQFRQRLSLLGVDARSLFPGLRGLASQISAEAKFHTGSYDWVF